MPSAIFAVLFLAWAALKSHDHVGGEEGSSWKASSLLDIASLVLACSVFALLMTRSASSPSGGDNYQRPFAQPLLLQTPTQDEGETNKLHLFPDAPDAAAAWVSSGPANPAEEASLGSLMFFSYITKFMAFGRYW